MELVKNGFDIMVYLSLAFCHVKREAEHNDMSMTGYDMIRSRTSGLQFFEDFHVNSLS